MKRLFKITGITLFLIILVGLIFFVIDINRINKEKTPIFCFEYKEVNDSGTKEYLGLGYKVIAYDKLNGYDKTHIGSWFMKYDVSLSENIEENKKKPDNTSFELIYNREKNLAIDTIIIKNELIKYDYNIYSYGGSIEIKIANEIFNLRDVLVDNNIDMEEIIQKCINDKKEGEIKTDVYLDGGSIIYKYDNYWLIKCNSLEGNKDVYIGMPNMNLTGTTVEFIK